MYVYRIYCSDLERIIEGKKNHIKNSEGNPCSGKAACRDYLDD